MAASKSSPAPSFARRTWFVFAIGAFALICWQLMDVFLLAFGAVIVAVLLRSIADPISRRSSLNEKASLIVTGLLMLTVLGGAGWLFGATVGSQVTDLFDRMPHSVDELRTLLARLPFGDRLAEEIGGFGNLASSLKGAVGRLGGYAMSVAGALTNMLLVLFAGIYLAIKPRHARDGLVMLLRKETAPPVKHALDTCGQALRLWLLGAFADMAVVGVLTGIGVALIGLPSPLALGLFAGLAAFVPIVGPIVSVIPGLLLAAQEGPQMVLWTIVVYVAVQQIESNFFYPFIQRRAVNLPPALTLFGVLAFGVLFGPLGVIFATPLLVVLLVLVKLLYVRRVLGREVSVPGEDKS